MTLFVEYKCEQTIPSIYYKAQDISST